MYILGLLVVTSQLLAVHGAPTLTMNPNPADIDGEVILTCTDATFTAGSAYQFNKNSNTVFNQAGEIVVAGKYSEESETNGEIKLKITGLLSSDEDAYTCVVGFLESPSVTLQVQVSPIICPRPEDEEDCCSICYAHIGLLVFALILHTIVICEVITIVLKLHKDNNLDAWIFGGVNVVLPVIYTIWFIVRRVEPEDFDCECCKDYKDELLGLLSVECISIVVGIIAIIYLSYNYKVLKFWCSGCKSTGCEPDNCGPTGNNQSPPSNSGNRNATQPKHSTFKTDSEVKHRPQPPPPTARNGSDLSGISRKDIDLKTPLAPIAPASTTSVHYRGQHDDEHSGMPKNRGLSAVFDPEPSMGAGNRLTPIDQVAEAEPKKKKKKKKKNEDFGDEEEE